MASVEGWITYFSVKSFLLYDTPRVTQAYVEVTYRTATDSTVYAGGLYEKKLNGDVTKYYEFAGRRIAMRTQVAALGAIETGAQCTNSTDDDGDTVVNDGCARYILSDHLGSTSTVVDRNGTTATVKYWPFGATRSSSGTLGTDKLYTGQQDEPNDPALGLYHYGARFYSTVLGRFASVDPIVGSASDPQSWNGYSYVRNNPLRYADPTGMDPVCLIMCGGSGHDVIVEDYRCHACAGKSAAEVDAIRLGMMAAAVLQALRDIDAQRQLEHRAALRLIAKACADPRACSGVLHQGWGALGQPLPIPGTGAGGVIEWGPLGAAAGRALLNLGTKATLVGIIASTALIPNDTGHQGRQFAIRLQAQGGGVEKSWTWSSTTPITAEEGLQGLAYLKSQLSPKELEARAIPFSRAERFIRNAAAGGGIGPSKHPFAVRGSGGIPVDVEVLRGVNFTR